MRPAAAAPVRSSPRTGRAPPSPAGSRTRRPESLPVPTEPAPAGAAPDVVPAPRRWCAARGARPCGCTPVSARAAEADSSMRGGAGVEPDTSDDAEQPGPETEPVRPVHRLDGGDRTVRGNARVAALSN